MEKETLDKLSDAISDTGYLFWWLTQDDIAQIQFGGVQFTNQDTLDKNCKSTMIALQFRENSFLTFFDNGEEPDWYIKLYEKEIEPPDIDYDFFEFNNNEKINAIKQKYKNNIIIKEKNNADETKYTLAFTAGNIAVIIGGNQLDALTYGGIIDDNTVINRNKLWWIYWEDYWKKRDTEQAYEEDYACKN